MKNIGSESGLEAWRELSRRYDPTIVNRRRNLMSTILSPGTFKVNELLVAIERWEEQVRQFEKRKNAYGERKQIDEEIKAGIMQQMCPDSLCNHLYMNASRFRNYNEIRMEITSFLEARNQSDTATPMDVGSMWKGGKGDKGKGKGKDFKGGKGKDKGHKGFKGDKGKGKGKGDKGKGASKGDQSHNKGGKGSGRTKGSPMLVKDLVVSRAALCNTTTVIARIAGILTGESAALNGTTLGNQSGRIQMHHLLAHLP